MADAGNGDVHHIESPEVLDEVFAEELAAAGAVRARGVTVEVTLPAALAVAENLNGYPQEAAENGISVHLGDVARTKDLVLELSTPVELGQETVTIGVAVRYTDRDGTARSLVQDAILALVDPADVAGAPERIDVVRRVLELVDARARMTAMELFDGGDVGAAKAALARGRAQTIAVAACYALSPETRAGVDETLAQTAGIDQMLDAGSISAVEAKRLHSRSRNVNRSRESRD